MVPKQRIQATKNALKEADNWTTLTNEIEDALDNGDLALISQKLNGIQGSLKILSHVPDFEDRVILVEGLKNRLEALASPQLGAKYLVFVSSCSIKMREFSLLSLYTF